MPLPYLIAGALRSGSEGGYNPFTGMKSLWQDVTGVTAANEAADIQTQGYADAQAMLDPYNQAGQGALSAQQALLGLSGAGAQADAIAGIEAGPQFQAMVDQGEAGILANASATGGLRGGNTQAALAQFRPQVLSQLINQRLANLGGITGMGFSAAGQGAGLATGAANAAAAVPLTNYNLQRNMITDIAGAGMTLATGLPMPSFGGSGAPSVSMPPPSNLSTNQVYGVTNPAPTFGF